MIFFYYSSEQVFPVGRIFNSNGSKHINCIYLTPSGLSIPYRLNWRAMDSIRFSKIRTGLDFFLLFSKPSSRHF